MPNVIKGHPINSERSKNYGNNFIQFNSLKNNQNIICESELEFSGFMHLEADPHVAYYTPHPGREIEVDGEVVGIKRIFDVLVTETDKSQKFIEFKYESDMDELTGSERSLSQIAEQKAFCEEKGIDYETITDKFLYEYMGSHYINNCIYIVQKMKRVTIPVAIKQGESLIAIIESLGGQATLEQIISSGENAEKVFDGICALIYTGKAGANLGEVEICYKTEVYLYEN